MEGESYTNIHAEEERVCLGDGTETEYKELNLLNDQWEILQLKS